MQGPSRNSSRDRDGTIIFRLQETPGGTPVVIMPMRTRRAPGLMTSQKTVIFWGLVLIIIVSLGLGLSWSMRRRAFATNYAEIAIGDSEERVVALYGRPDETSDCSEYKRPSYLDEVQRNCVKVYWYRSFLQQWVFFFDRDDRVIHKAYNVMY